MLKLSPGDIARFWSKLDRQPGGCWLWTGWTTPQGYGRFDVGKAKILASHMALILTGQPRPPAPNDYALHGDTCVSTACCNPAHLRWGHAKANAEDRERLGRRIAARGERARKSHLTEDDVRVIRGSSERQCDLARQFQVSKTAIRQIQLRRHWAHVV